MTTIDALIPDDILLDHVGVLGATGAGKSYLARSLVERLLALGRRVVVVDPTGVWWGLRLGPNGRRASGFDVAILGGKHADLPLGTTLEAGTALACAIGGSSASVILDTKSLSVGARTRLFTGFAETILAANAGPLHLVIDEAHLFAPQGRGGGDFEQAALTHATNNLVALGRSSGLRILLITQRPAKLHKDAITQAKAVVAMQVFHRLDRGAVKGWLDGAPDPSAAADILASLSSLKTGEGWIYAPQHDVLRRASFPAIATFDSMRPLSADETPALKPLDVAALRAAMSMSATSATKKTSKGAAKPSEKADAAERPASAAELAEAEQRGEARGYQAGLRFGFDSAVLQLDDGMRAVASEFHRLVDGLERPYRADAPATPGPNLAPAPKPLRQSKAAAPALPAPRPSGELSRALQRVVDAIAWWHVSGHDKVPRARASVVAGFSPRASTFRGYIAELTARGLVVSEGGGVRLTDAGGALARAPAVASARDAARALLKPQAARVLDVVCDAWPEEIRRVDVAAALGLSSEASTARGYIGAVVAHGLIEGAGSGAVRAVDWLFTTTRKGGRK